MDKIMLDKTELETEIISILEREKHIVLATCSDGRVSARTVSFVNEGTGIFFQTDKGLLKVEQILKNPKIALCSGNLQIEGSALIQGHPNDAVNEGFRDLYKLKHPKSFEMYAAMKNEIVIKINPSLFTLWKYIDGKPCRDYLNIIENYAYREFYEFMD